MSTFYDYAPLRRPPFWPWFGLYLLIATMFALIYLAA